MRILQVVHQYPPERIGGTELYTLALAKGLNHRGHRAAVFHRAPGPPGLAQSEWEGVPTYRACAGEMNSVSVYRSSFGDASLFDAFAGAIKHFRPELIHVQHLKGLPTAVVGLAQERKIPLVHTLHDFWTICANAQLLTNYDQTICDGPTSGCTNCARCAIAMLGNSASVLAFPAIAALMTWRNLRLARALQAAEVIIAPTRFVRDWFVAQDWPEERITVVPHGIEPPPVDVAGKSRSDRHITVAYVGGLARQKGVHTLVEAFSGLQGAELWIAGDEAFDPAYVSYLRSLASPNVRFLGRLEHEEVWATLAQADAVAIPSLWYETFSLIAHEAFAAGVPVIASDLGALSEAIHHGEDGWLVTPGDVGTWRETLNRLVGEPDLLTRARASIHPPVTQEEHLNQIEGLYMQAADRYGGSP